jgi:hypothetical protein
MKETFSTPTDASDGSVSVDVIVEEFLAAYGRPRLAIEETR